METKCKSAFETATNKVRELESKVAELERKAVGLAAAESAAKESIGSLTAQTQALLKQLEASGTANAEQLRAVQAALADAKANEATAAAQLSGATEGRVAAEQKEAAAARSLGELEARNKELSDELSAKNTRIAELENNITHLQAEKERIGSEISTLLQSRNDTENKLKETQAAHDAKLRDLESQHTAAIQKINEKYADRIRRRDENVAAAKAERDQLKRSQAASEEQLRDARASIASNAIKIKQNEEEISRLADKANAAKSELESQKDDFERARAKFMEEQGFAKADLQKELKKKQDALEKATQSLASISQNAATIQKANLELAQQIAAAKAETADAKAKLEAISEKGAALQAELDAARAASAKEMRDVEVSAAAEGDVTQQTLAKHTQEIATQIQEAENKNNEVVDALKAQLERESAERAEKIAELEREKAALSAKETAARDALEAAQAAHAKRIEEIEGEYKNKTSELQARYDSLEVNKKALETELEKLKQLKQRQPVETQTEIDANIGSLQLQLAELKGQRDAAIAQLATATTAQKSAEAKMKEMNTSYDRRLNLRVNGIFEEVRNLALKVEKNEEPQKDIGPNFRAIYDRMKGLKNSSAADARTKAQRALCYLNYFVSYFLTQFFFLNSDAERGRIYGALDTAVSGMEASARKSVLQDLFGALSAAEGGSAPVNPGRPTQTLLAAVAGEDNVAAIKGFFLQGFSSYRGFADKPVLGTTYPVAMAAFIVVARKYLLDLSEELAIAQCPISEAMKTPVAIDTGAGADTGLQLPIRRISNVTNSTRRLRRPTEMIKRAALEIAKKEEAFAKYVERKGSL